MAIPTEIDNPKFSPALVIKPHHVLRSPVRDALLKKDKLDILLLGYVGLLHIQQKKTLHSDADYSLYNDVLGISRKDRQRFRKSAGQFLRNLYELPDESFVHLDLQPDGICSACFFGIHCSGTNFQTNSSLIESVAVESACINRILNRLKNNKQEEGTDFIFCPTVHTLYDFQRRTIAESSQAIPQQVRFDSLIVRMGALRDIAITPAIKIGYQDLLDDLLSFNINVI